MNSVPANDNRNIERPGIARVLQVLGETLGLSLFVLSLLTFFNLLQALFH